MQTMAPIMPTQLPYQQQYPAYQYQPQLYNDTEQENRKYRERAGRHAERAKDLLRDLLQTDDGKLHVVQALVHDKKKTNRAERLKKQMEKINGMLDQVLQNGGDDEDRDTAADRDKAEPSAVDDYSRSGYQL